MRKNTGTIEIDHCKCGAIVYHKGGRCVKCWSDFWAKVNREAR
jgi:hypothetical protein